MPKFQISVERIYWVAHVVEADDEDHAREIAKEVDDYMDADRRTFQGSEYFAQPCSEDSEVTYEPQANYLK